MNTEKIEKLKKSLSNNLLPADLKPKIEAEIKRLEDLDSTQPSKRVAKKTSKAKSSRTTTPKRTAMSLAKEIRKDGESWTDAVKRAGKMMKDKSHTATKDVETELTKLAEGGYLTDPTFGTFQNQVFADGGGVEQKKYNMQFNVGKAKYVINTYDGVKKNKDGSEFYDIHIFKTKSDLDEFQRKLIKDGYKYSYADGGEVYSHKHSKGWGEDITIELLEPTAKGWKVKQTTKKGTKTTTKTAFFSKQEINELFEKQYSDGGYFDGTISNYPKNAPLLESGAELKHGGFRQDRSTKFIDKNYEVIVYPEKLEILIIITNEDTIDKDGLDASGVKWREEDFGYSIEADNKTEFNKAIKVILGVNKRFAEGGYLTDPTFGTFQNQVFADGGGVGYSKKERVIDYYYNNDVFDDYETYGLSEDDLNNENKVVKAIIKYHDLDDPKMVKERFNNLGLIEYADGGGVYAKGGEIEFKHSNLRIVGTGMDRNGNRVVKVSFPNQRPFSIQSNGTLPKTHILLRNYDEENTNFSLKEIESMEDEILDYVENYGSANQKKSLKVYGSWLDKNHYADGGKLNNKTQKMRKQKLKKGDTVTVYGKRWFDRVNGNTYHTAEVEVNGTTLGKSPMTYGYDDQYLETAKGILLEQYDLPRGMTERSPMWQLRDYGVTLTKYVTDGLKRDLAKGGGVTFKNGREYPTGRNWTNDHRHINKSDDHEVKYTRKKKFELGGTMATDLAGHTGGGDAGLNAGMPLDGVSGTAYTGLVGETGAMSSGELFENGGDIDSKNITVAKRLKVKKWYLKTYPTDDLGEEINPDIDFWLLWRYISQGYNVYDVLGVRDSVIRERVFEKLSEILKIDYDVIYKKWLNSDSYELGGGLPSGAEQSYMVTEALGNPAQHLAKGGGVKTKNGQTYNYGRVWTKDHNEFDKGSDHEVEYRRKQSSFFAKGGAMENIKYDDVLEVLKEKLENSIDELPSQYEYADNFKGEEVEKQSRDGFIAYTDGGYEVTWFEYMSMFIGSGYGLPTKPLDDEMQRQVDYNYQLAKETFIENYPEIAEELGEDNIDYSSLYEAGYESEAEELSEMELNYDGDDTIMCEIGAYYYDTENYRGVDEKHTIRLYGLVNLESPYHRRGNLDDSYDIDITFDSISELKEKVDAGLKEIIDWFDGKYYNDSDAEMKIRRMADGGNVGHSPKKIKQRLEELRKELRAERISYGELVELQSLAKYIDPNDVELLEPAGVPEFEDDEDNYAKGGKMAKGGKVSPFKNMMETNTITEKEINLIKLRLNNDKVDEATQEAIDYIWDNSPKLTPDQNKKGIDYLRNLWKSPTGKERTNNPFGYREQDTLETFEYFELRGFYDAGNRYRKFYVPLYTCVGADSSFEYAFYNGEVNILG